MKIDNIEEKMNIRKYKNLKTKKKKQAKLLQFYKFIMKNN